jgi:hypothetical protein
MGDINDGLSCLRWVVYAENGIGCVKNRSFGLKIGYNKSFASKMGRLHPEQVVYVEKCSVMLKKKSKMDRLRREQADCIESELFIMKTGRLRVEKVSYVEKKNHVC